MPDESVTQNNGPSPSEGQSGGNPPAPAPAPAPADDIAAFINTAIQDGGDEKQKENDKSSDEIPIPEELSSDPDFKDYIPKFPREVLPKLAERIKYKPWYELPDAYELAPEYRELTSLSNQVSSIVDHWKAQLVAAENGSPVVPLTVNQDGSISLGEELEPTAEVKADIIQRLARAERLQEAINQKLTGLKTSYQGEVSKFYQDLQKLDGLLFGKLDMSKPHIAQGINKWLNQIPGPMRNAPVYQMLAKALFAIEILTKDKIRPNVNSATNLGPSGPMVSGKGQSDKDMMKLFSQITGEYLT